MNGQRFPRLVALAAVVLFAGTGSRAQPAPAKETRGSPSPITAAVIEKLPRYVAPAPAKPIELAPPAVEIQESPEGTLNLPTITVRREKTAPPPDPAWVTAKGKLDGAMKSNPALKIGNLFGLNQGIALFMQREEREAKAKAALAELVDHSTIDDDSPESQRIRALLGAALQQPNVEWLASRRGK